MPSLSSIESRSLGRVFASTRDRRWYRPVDHVERVTLAGLHGQGLLERRAWRGFEGTESAAHEYMVAVTVQEDFQRRSVAAATPFGKDSPWFETIALALEYRPEVVTLAYLRGVTHTQLHPSMPQFLDGMRRFLMPERGPEPAFRWTKAALLLRVFKPEAMRLDGAGAPLESANA